MLLLVNLTQLEPLLEVLPESGVQEIEDINYIQESDQIFSFIKANEMIDSLPRNQLSSDTACDSPQTKADKMFLSGEYTLIAQNASSDFALIIILNLMVHYMVSRLACK